MRFFSLSVYFLYARKTSFKFSKFNISADMINIYGSLSKWIDDFILHISYLNNFSNVLLVFANDVIKN